MWLSYWASRFALDYGVYWDASKVVLQHGGVPYGEDSGLSWPMWYRYPPLLLLLFAPLTLLPLQAGAFLWALGKCMAVVELVRSLAERLSGVWEVELWLPAAAVAVPYWAMELRYGNAQFYVFALTATALLWAHSKPRLAGVLLGSAIAIKVWPLFFVPLLFLKSARRTVAVSLVVAVVLTMAPAVVFGWSTNLEWLGDWYEQESSISADAGAIWFPSQSFYGVARRHLSVIDYSVMPDTNYRNIHWAELSPETVRWIWLAAASIACLALFAGAWRSGKGRDLEWAALAFCALVLFEPFSQKQIALTVLTWPAVVASSRARGWARVSFLAAAFIAVYQLLLPGDMQRLLQVVGLDAAVVVLLALSLIPSALRADASCS